MIQIDNVSKSFKRVDGGRREVFRNISLTIEKTDRIAFMGPRLSGKSTLIKMITGFEQPDSGTVSRFCDISYPIGNSTVLSSNMTGKENIAFICRIFGCDTRETLAFIQEFTGLGGALDRELALYARDDRSRLAYALSYALPFDIYVLDGSFGAGTPDFKNRCEALLEKRMETSGILFATAYTSFARYFCKKIVLIDDCQLVEYDDLDAGIEHFKELKAKYDQGDAA
jgi:capsular polysaccharide transport system ATP-binding protein